MIPLRQIKFCMKKLTVLIAIVLMALPFSSCTQNTGSSDVVPAKVELKTQLDSVSYAMGVSVGSQIHGIGVDEWNYEAFMKAFHDAMTDEALLIQPQQIGQILDPFFMRLQQKQMEDMQGNAQENLEKGREFLEKNKNKKGVKVTESGLQYEVMTMGDGPKPKATDRVKVHYHGTLTDGTVFESTVEAGIPVDFGLNQVIPGWTEGVQLMPVGSKFRFFIPSELAYGANPRSGGPIGPNMALIFEIELLEIME